MRTTLQYLRTLYKGQQSFLYAVPLLCLIVWLAGVFFLSMGMLDVITNYNSYKSAVGESNLLLALDGQQFFEWSNPLILILPFIHLTFIATNFYKSYDFTLPISAGQRLTAFIIVALVVFLYNYAIVLLLNYGVEFFFRYNFLEAMKQAYVENGLLYEPISKNSIFFNGSQTLKMFRLIIGFAIMLPFYFYGILLFKKKSLIKSVGILILLFMIGSYISNYFWNGNHYMITNSNFYFVSNYLVYLIAMLIAFVGFYYYLKEKEV